MTALVRQMTFGPLRRPVRRGRYLVDTLGQAVYLTGSHTWHTLIDQLGARPVLDFEQFLAQLADYGHNFTRLWAAEHALVPQADGRPCAFSPLPFARTGPGMAFDGLPKFDLTRFNQEFITRLYERVQLAEQYGIYVAVMLFEGWGVDGFDKAAGTNADFCAWQGHPFHRDNNINGIDGDPHNTGDGRLVHTLELPAITAIQRRYVHTVLETLRDCPNVLFEIANEAHAESVAWQHEMIRTIHEWEDESRGERAIGMTALRRSTNNRAVRTSNADWYSPAQTWGRHAEDFRNNPPATSNRTVVLLDTDHIYGVGGDAAWVWKSFLRGYNPIYMDDLGDEPWKHAARCAMGVTRQYANQLDMAETEPRPRLASSGFCLVRRSLRFPSYLAYAPNGQVTVQLGRGQWHTEWVDVATSMIFRGTPTNGGRQSFQAPFTGDAVLVVRAQQ